MRHAARPMPVVNEDTFILMSLVEQNEALYDDCFRVTLQTLENHPPRGNLKHGVGRVAARARNDLRETLFRMVTYSEDKAIQEHLTDAGVDWLDVAREFIADVLYGERNDL